MNKKSPNRIISSIILLPLLSWNTGWAVTDIPFINEIHYDNAGGDIGETVEIAAPAGTNLTGWSLVFYNGSSSQRKVYMTENLSGEVTDQCNGFGTLSFAKSGIQNGGPDGVALVDNSGIVQQFLSYEGTFIAVDGPAAGLTSNDIGVSESSGTTIGESLQLGGDGRFYNDFSWNAAASDTFALPNTSQSFDGVSCNGDEEIPLSLPLTISKIHDIQGIGANVVPGTYSVEAIVVADYQDGNELSGFFIQEEDADVDANLATSEGLFVFCGACTDDVFVGDKVQVTGSASDFFGMSQLSANSVTVVSSANTLPTPAIINLPIAVSSTTDVTVANDEIDAFYESVEGMLVEFNGDLTVDESFQLSRFGQVVLSEGGRPRQFTDVNVPDAGGLLAHQINLATRRIILDDNSNNQNFALFNDVAIFYPEPGFSISSFIRGGDSITQLTGVLHWSWAGAGGTDAWRVRPVVEAYNYNFTNNNPRTAQPTAVGGSLKVASFNVLNYFNTIDEGFNLCGPSNIGCRGADSAAELTRQTQKLVSAICTINADIVGLIEIENNSFSSLNTLTTALNSSCGPYAFVNSGTIGGDAIKQGLIYKPSSVDLVGSFAVLDTAAFTDPNDLGSDKNRPALAQSFIELASGEQLTVVVNHLKSKGSSCGAGDDDTLTGQGNCNLTRTLAAQEEVNWLNSDPTGTGVDKILVLGDLNAYAKEDPIVTFKLAGFADLLKISDATAYSYLFNGQLGTLDYGLANVQLLPFVSGVTSWHINADEVNVLDYNDTILDDTERSFEPKPNALPLFDTSAYRASDHDPVIVGLNFASNESDFNLDGSVDGCIGRGDVIVLLNAIRAGTADSIWDFNADGRVTRADARTIMNFYTNPRGICLAPPTRP